MLNPISLIGLPLCYVLKQVTSSRAYCRQTVGEIWQNAGRGNLHGHAQKLKFLFLQGRSPCQHRLLHDFRRRFLLVILSCLRWIFKIRYFKKHINFALLLDELSPPPTYLILLLSLFSLRGIISCFIRAKSREPAVQTFRDDSLVPRRSPPAHSTRLVATCRDVTGPFGESLNRVSEKRRPGY